MSASCVPAFFKYKYNKQKHSRIHLWYFWISKNFIVNFTFYMFYCSYLLFLFWQQYRDILVDWLYRRGLFCSTLTSVPVFHMMMVNMYGRNM